MSNTYVTALVESLEKKIEVLKEIEVKNAEQAALLKEESFSFDKFDANAEAKGILIHRLTKLDEGFESLFKRVKEELDNNRPQYAAEIRKMQELIREIMAKSTSIEASEARNKAALEKIFSDEKAKIKATRSTAKALKSYTQAMNYKN